MAMSGDTSAAAKKPDYSSNATLPKGSDVVRENIRGQYPTTPAKLDIKGIGPKQGGVECKY